MAKEQQTDKSQARKPAHDVILAEMKRLCSSGDEKEKKSSTEKFAELCLIMEGMVIPKDKIGSIISELTVIILETPIYKATSEEAVFKVEVAKKVGMAQCLISRLEVISRLEQQMEKAASSKV